MKILVFTDLHAQFQHIDSLREKAKGADLVISTGDHTLWGSGEKELFDFLESTKKPCIVMHGNHESEKEVRKACEGRKNILFMHNQYADINGLLIIAHGGGGFSDRYPSFERNEKQFADAMKLAKKTLLLTHAPPIDTKMDQVPGIGSVGSTSYREFIEKYQPEVAVCGHIHEGFGKKDKIGKTIILNPAPKGAIINI